MFRTNGQESVATNSSLMEYMKHRYERYDSWFEKDRDEVLENADANGTVLDFAIVGLPKCGTTTMEANLGYIAPMPIADVCTRIPQTVYYSYRNWPNRYPDAQGRNDTKLYRGTKCPSSIHNLRDWSRYLPRTKLIVGIRHPVLWFQSFWNMQALNQASTYRKMTPYDLTGICTGCRFGCPGRRKLFCVARSRFHLALAAIGKTPLNETERALLAANDPDGGDHFHVKEKIRNTIFLYEQTELKEDDVWESLARLLHYPQRTIPHDKYHSSHGKRRDNNTNTINICDEQYDKLRMLMMPYAWEMSQWICAYFVPSPDVVVANHTRFCSIVKDYANDPCGRLVRMPNGTYILKEGYSIPRSR